MNVKVYYMSGGKQWERTYPKIYRVTEGEHALRLEVKKYQGLPYDREMVHVVSIPYTSMAAWEELES
jgi:hypothetical protein